MNESVKPGATHVPAAYRPACGRRWRALHRVYPTLLLLLLFGLLVFSIEHKSPTVDEQNHLARGLAVLKTGDLRLSQEHPPAANAWAAWSLLLDPRVRLPLEHPSWASAEWYSFADRLLWRSGLDPHPQTMLFATRVPVIWLTLLLAALGYRWARDLGGRWAGGIALTMLVFDPNLLAHGRLTTNDGALACAVLAASYALWRALRARTAGAAALAGAALGAALLAKFSALVLVPIAVAILLVAWFPGATHAGPRRLGRASHLALYLAVAALVVWAGYGFSWGPIAFDRRPVGIGGLPGPAPAFWAGIQAILRRTGGGSSAFLLGRHSATGWWYYFPVAFLVKTPLATLVILGLAIGLGIRELATSAGWRAVTSKRWQPALLCLALPPLGFWSMAIAGSFNIGYRHILPSLPFVYIAAAWSLSRAGFHTRRPERVTERRVWKTVLQVCTLVLLLWLALNTLLLAPHYLANFNLLAGGPKNGYRVLVDSNLDWGQDLPGLARAVQGEERIYLSWFGAAHPEAYELAFHPLPGFWRFGGEAAAYGYNPLAPAPGLYAISATTLQGVKMRDHDLYAWFRDRKPDAHVGHSILLYRVKAAPEETLGPFVLGVTLAQVEAEDRDLLRAAQSVRAYDPSTGLIVPRDVTADGPPSGGTWYISSTPPEGAEVLLARPGYTLAQLIEGPRASLPLAPPVGAHFGYVRALEAQLGAESDVPAKTLTVIARWQVVEPPHRAATSFAHLLDAQGAYLAGWDGLTAPATCWQAGDWIEQRYTIALPPDLPPGSYPIEIGWYDADTGQRWAYQVGDEIAGDRWLLEWESGRVEEWTTGRAGLPFSTLPHFHPSNLPKDGPT